VKVEEKFLLVFGLFLVFPLVVEAVLRVKSLCMFYKSIFNKDNDYEYGNE